MVTTPSWKQTENLSDGFADFNGNAAKNLARLIRLTNSDIILTTTHRNRFSEIEWTEIMNRRGIKTFKIESMDKYLTEMRSIDSNQSSSRLYQIVQWANRFSHNKKFVIIDDDSALYDLPTHLKNKWVKTLSYKGLDDTEMEKALNILTQAHDQAQAS